MQYTKTGLRRRAWIQGIKVLKSKRKVHPELKQL